ncbi:MAG: NADH-quinone oxidoreductase subunit N [Bryobacteraceae bacterium]|jgi:NADH-quinone oxidoreductase subunit N
MPASFTPPLTDYLRVLPELILTVAGVVIMLLEAVMGKRRNRNGLGYFALVALLAAGWGSVVALATGGPAFGGLLIVDGYATFFRILVIGVGFMAILQSFQYLQREKANCGEYYALILFSIVGQSVMASANELIMVFIGLEISSIATYVLADFLREDRRNNESSIKYFLLGSFATAFLLYGVAWIYGATGTTSLPAIRIALRSANHDTLTLAGVAAALIFAGFAFKVSAVPFQIWAPDVYQGAPAPVSAFMSAGPKAAAFAVFVRVFMTAFHPIVARWDPFVWGSALLSMIVGNFAALTQQNIKRMLAYSSIAHAGYILVAIAANSQIGIAAVMFYLAAYAFMQVGAFAVISYFSRQGERYVNVDDLAGLGWRQPVIAALFTVLLLSFIGVPLTAGFFGKFYIFKAALDAHLVWLAVLGLLNSAVAAYYYLRILVVMYMREPGEASDSVAAPTAGIQLVLWGSVIGTLVLGIYPSLLLNFATYSSTLGR